jgi:hypothetical protein
MISKCVKEGGIVADGARRHREARDYQAIRARILAEVTRRFASEQAKASFWQRLQLAVKIRREVHAQMQREFPPGCLHIAAFRGKSA